MAAAERSFNLLINSACSRSRCRSREGGGGGGDRAAVQEGAGEGGEEGGSWQGLCQMSGAWPVQQGRHRGVSRGGHTAQGSGGTHLRRG